MARSKLPDAAREYFRQAGSRGGKLGTKARMEKLTPEKRSDVARLAANARWKKAKKNQKLAPKEK